MKKYQILSSYLIFLFNCGETLDLTNPPVTPDKLKYYLYNSSSPEASILLDITNGNVLSQSDPIVVLIHGFTQNGTTGWYRLAKKALFARDHRYQLLLVDWSFYAELNYFYASDDAGEVGYVMAEFVAILVQKYFIPLKNFLFVGHSLGAHVAGFMGQKLFELLEQKPTKIIGLDPAGPLFEDNPENERLSSDDAEVVHVIHTSGGIFGIYANSGTVDFFPNGGSLQPGCVKEYITNIYQANFLKSCNHLRSLKYFIEGIQATTPAFVARRCKITPNFFLPSWLACSHETEEMCSLKTTKTGKFFPKTNANPPYSKS